MRSEMKENLQVQGSEADVCEISGCRFIIEDVTVGEADEVDGGEGSRKIDETSQGQSGFVKLWADQVFDVCRMNRFSSYSQRVKFPS